jgi:hypothetical protein
MVCLRQIDPFGHSSVTPTFWSDFGMHGLGLNRINVSEKEQRKKDKTLQFIYRGSNSLGTILKENFFVFIFVPQFFYKNFFSNNFSKNLKK